MNTFWFLIQELPFVAASRSGNVSFVQEPVSEEIFSKYKYKYKYSVQERVSEEMFTSMSNIRLGGSFLHLFVCLFNISLLCSFIFVMEHNKWTNKSPSIDKLSRTINYFLTYMLYLLSLMFISSRQVVSLAFYETNHIYEFIAMLWHGNSFFSIVIGTVKLSDLLHQMAVINILSCYASYHAAKIDVSIVLSQIAVL